jgi:hypothetical protein
MTPLSLWSNFSRLTLNPCLPTCPRCPFLYFQQLTTIKFCNSFLLITIQNAGGVYLHSRQSSPRLQTPLQICTFAFNNFRDAPPATPSFSNFGVVARGWLGIPFCTPRHVATNASRTEERVRMCPKGSALYENQRRDYFSALPAGSLAASFAADSFAAASLAAALAWESRYQSKVIWRPRSNPTCGS